MQIEAVRPRVTAARCGRLTLFCELTQTAGTSAAWLPQHDLIEHTACRTSRFVAHRWQSHAPRLVDYDLAVSGGAAIKRNPLPAHRRERSDDAKLNARSFASRATVHSLQPLTPTSTWTFFTA